MEKGLDLCALVDTATYNQWISQSGAKLPLLPVSRALLIGNTRALWPVFKEHFIHQAISTENPIDDYCRRSVHACFPGLQARFSHDVGDRFVHMQMLAQISGMAYFDESCQLSIHKEFGAWISLRALVLLEDTSNDSSLIVAASNPNPDRNVKLMEKFLKEFALLRDKEKLIEMRRVASNFTASDHSFSREQIEYHYGINRLLF